MLVQNKFYEKCDNSSRAFSMNVWLFQPILWERLPLNSPKTPKLFYPCTFKFSQLIKRLQNFTHSFYNKTKVTAKSISIIALYDMENTNFKSNFIQNVYFADCTLEFVKMAG